VVHAAGRRTFAMLLAACAVALGPSASALTRQGGDTSGAMNMHVIAHNDFGGGDLGKGGEGFSEVPAADGHRILYVANESGPVCFNVVDVTDPRNPILLSRVNVPNADVRCNNLDASGHLLAVANQVTEAGKAGAGVQVFDITDPRSPRQVGDFDTSGPFSRGAHYVWFADGRFLHVSTGMPDFQPRRPGLDDQIYVIADLADPAHPREVGRWWYPGTREGDPEPLPTPNQLDEGCRMHNVEVFPDRPNLAYIAYIDCGIVVLDISDKAHPRVAGELDDSPPEPGFTHTVMPLRGGRFLAVTHEAVDDLCADFPKRITFFDARDPARLRQVSEAPLPANTADLCEAGGRFGAHNIHENYPDELAFHSDRLIVGSFFNGGVRVYDVGDISHPQEVAFDVPPAPEGSTAGTIQINDVYVDDRGVVFAVDRFGGGLYVLRSPVIDRELNSSPVLSADDHA
jgi:hypothetical protein